MSDMLKLKELYGQMEFLNERMHEVQKIKETFVEDEDACMCITLENKKTSVNYTFYEEEAKVLSDCVEQVLRHRAMEIAAHMGDVVEQMVKEPTAEHTEGTKE